MSSRGCPGRTAASCGRCHVASRRKRLARFGGKAGKAAVSAILLLLCFSLTQTKPAKTNPPPYWRAALDLAQKGAEEAIACLHGDKRREGPEFALSGEWASSVARGEYRVRVEAPDEFTRMIDSTGIVRDFSRTTVRRTVRLKMRRPALFNSAAITREGLFVEPEVVFGSYNSAEKLSRFSGEMARGNVATNPGESIRAAAFISDGPPAGNDVAIAPGGDEKNGGLAKAAKEDQERTHEVNSGRDFPLILPPWGLKALPAINLSGDDVLSVHESGTYPSVTIEGSSSLIVDGEASIYVVGSMIIKGMGRLVIGGDVANVAFYVEKDITVEKTAAVVNLSGRPSALSIHGMDRRSSIAINSQHRFVGTIYAPQSEITIGPELGFFGAVCGWQVRFCRGATVCYDEALGSVPSAWRRFEVASREEM